MIDIVTDPSKQIKYYFRVNSTPLPKTLTFLDEDGNPYPVNTKTWQVNFKRNVGDTTNVLQLLSGSGLTIGTNSITIIPTAAQVNIQPRSYFIEVRNVTDSQSWFTGLAVGHNGEFDNFETDDLSITVASVVVGGDVAYESNGDIKVFKNTAKEISLGNELLETLSTGIYAWLNGGFSFVGTTLTVSPGSGHIVLNVDDDSDNWTYTDVDWIQQDITVNTTGVSYIYIDSSGIVQKTTTQLTREQRKQNLFLGRVVVQGGVIVQATATPDVVLYPANQLHEVLDSLGLVNNGIIFSANGANLSLNRNSGGTLLSRGSNFLNSKFDFNQIAVPAATPATFQYRTQDPTLLLGNVTLVDPANYDVGGVVTAVPGASSRATVQRIYQFPPTETVPAGNIRIQYGQQWYTNLAAAIQAISTDPFVINPLVPGNGVLIAVIAITKGCTSLLDTSTARILPASKFGEIAVGGAGVSVTTLQQAYDNSSTGSITLASGKPLIIYDTNGTTVKERIGFPLVQASTATLTPDLSLNTEFEITAQAQALLIANPTGVISNFSSFIIRVTDNGTARALSYGAKYRAFGSALPTTTTIGKTLYIVCFYNSTDDLYDTVTREEV